MQVITKEEIQASVLSVQDTHTFIDAYLDMFGMRSLTVSQFTEELEDYFDCVFDEKFVEYVLENRAAIQDVLEEDLNSMFKEWQV